MKRLLVVSVLLLVLLAGCSLADDQGNVHVNTNVLQKDLNKYLADLQQRGAKIKDVRFIKDRGHSEEFDYYMVIYEQ